MFKVVLHSITLLLQADPSCLRSIYNNELMDLLAGCMHTMASSLIDTAVATALVNLLKTLLLCDHSQQKVVLAKYFKQVLLDAALWCTMPRETALFLHTELYHVFSKPSAQSLFTSMIPIQVYASQVIIRI